MLRKEGHKETDPGSKREMCEIKRLQHDIAYMYGMHFLKTYIFVTLIFKHFKL